MGKVRGIRDPGQTDLISLCEGEGVQPAKQLEDVASLQLGFTGCVVVCYKSENIQQFSSANPTPYPLSPNPYLLVEEVGVRSYGIGVRP